MIRFRSENFGRVSLHIYLDLDHGKIETRYCWDAMAGKIRVNRVLTGVYSMMFMGHGVLKEIYSVRRPLGHGSWGLQEIYSVRRSLGHGVMGHDSRLAP